MSLNAVSSSETSSRLQDLPPPSDAKESYIAQRGDTLSEIAKAHGVSLEGLLAANPQVNNPDVIYPDQSIALPAGTRALGGDAAPVNGAAPANATQGTYTGGSLDRTQLAQLFHEAGFRGENLVSMVAIAMRESTGDPAAFNGNRATGDQSYGLTQINMLGGMGPERREAFGLTSNEQLFDPQTNARVAFELSNNGTDLSPWGAYRGLANTYNTDVPAARAAVADAQAQGLLGTPFNGGARTEGAAPVQQSAPASATPTLERDDRGPAVADLQTRLAAAGFSPGTADGIFGARTESAVRSYQASRGIEVDGVVGPNTWAQLNGAPAVETPPAAEPVAPGEVAQVTDGPSNARIATLHPELRGQAAEFVNRVEQELGITLRVTSGMRTYAEQDALYAQGRTAPGGIVTQVPAGYSNHNFGTAFDVVEVRPDGSINWSPDWQAIGRVGTDMGLEWGGNWTTFVDRPHFQLDSGLSTADMRNRVAAGNVDADGFVNLR
ncbi:peptidoglycan-binding protein [Luteimonas sp. 3794]|uniref:peptidoglycan-binding protein n=1 Tax=Luteimonas sp. 3794 TaxID=2817730 RepID=UPI002863BD92|nr:peptidoglycan-binding protein [Luteimonas sp. 3794]MDR6990639.1 LysM repeat protein [Luteimonas sp. 3794]